MDTLNAPQGSFGLARVPRAGKRPLRAWDAADEYLLTDLAELFEDGQLPDSPTTLIVGDSFGALSCALAGLSPVVMTESAAGRQAISENLERNGRPSVEFASMTDPIATDTVFDLVVFKVPKSTAQLVDLLHRIRPHMATNTVILGAAMAKHIVPSVIDALEAIIGPTTTSLAVKKARLLSVSVEPAGTSMPNPWPKQWKAHGLTLTNHGGGFSPNKLDAGTGLLLDAVRAIDEPITKGFDRESSESFSLVDLGCGNGVIGLRLARLLTAAGIPSHVSAIDDSALAIAAAEQSWQASGLPEDSVSVSFHHAHRLANVVEPASVDLVVVNPPFHDDRVLGDETAWSMFVDAHKALRPGGRLIVVGNRHLAYHAKLKKIFGGVDNVASNAKFVVLESVRS